MCVDMVQADSIWDPFDVCLYVGGGWGVCGCLRVCVYVGGWGVGEGGVRRLCCYVCDLYGGIPFCNRVNGAVVTE